MNISEMLELNERAKEEGKQFPTVPYLFNEIQRELGKHFIGIVGPRGVGKTVILKQLAFSESDAFYLSADTLDESDLSQVARILSDEYKIRTLLVDEIHFCKTYTKDLKKIYDFFEIRVVFTSSVSLSLFDSAHDLSRRVLLQKSMGSISHRFQEILELRNIKQNYLLSCLPRPLYLILSIPKEPMYSKNQKY